MMFRQNFGHLRQHFLGTVFLIAADKDNVLAVAGAASGRTWILMVGLLLSVVLMGVAANLLARVLERRRWVAWIGLLIVLYVAAAMIWHGAFEVADAVST